MQRILSTRCQSVFFFVLFLGFAQHAQIVFAQSLNKQPPKDKAADTKSADDKGAGEKTANANATATDWASWRGE